MPDAPKGGQRAILSVGDLPPLFSTAVDQTGYDPVVTLSLSKAPPHTVFGNPTDNPDTLPYYYVLETTPGISSSDFLGLDDTPDDYTGDALKSVRVNAAEDGLEFFTPTTGGDFSSNASSSVVNELVLFADTTGKLGKRATTSGLAKLTSGVLSVTADNSTNWDTAYSDRLKWDGGATGLVAATGRTSLGLDIGTNVQAYDADLTTWAGLTPSANFQTMVPHTFAQMRTDLSLDNLTNDVQTKASVVPNTAPASGQILVGNIGGTAYAKQSLSGSGATITLNDNGQLNISNILNASLANSTITIAGTSTALGGSITQDTITGLSSTGLIKRTGANTLVIATAGTDYLTTVAFAAVTGDFALTQTPSLAADKLMGRGNGGGAGDWEAITLGTNLSMTGTTLNAAGGAGGGDASTNVATSVVSEVAVFADTTGKLLTRATGSGLAKLTAGVLSVVTDGSANWDTAYTERAQWDGGATNLVAATGRTSLALDNVTNDAQTKASIVPNTAATDGKMLVGLTVGGAYVQRTISGSGATISMGGTGILTISSILTASISDSQITLAKMADVATSTVFYRRTAGTGAPEVQTFATLKSDLGLIGNNGGDQVITLTGDVTGSGGGSFAATIAADAVTYAKMQNISAASRILGRGSAGGSGDTQELTVSSPVDLNGTVLDLDVAVNFLFTSVQTITIADAETGGASGPWLILAHNTSGTPATNLGSGIRFRIETSTTIDTDAGNIQCQWSDVAHATKTSYYDFQLCNAGSTPNSAMRLWGTGGLAIDHTVDPGAGIASANVGFKVIGNTGNAAAGLMGEYIEADLLTASATSLTTATAKTITSITLGAGDWDVTGVVYYKPANTTSVTVEQAGISNATNTMQSPWFAYSKHATIVYTTTPEPSCAQVTPTRRISISGSTIIYLVAMATFTVSTMTAYGHIQARRAR